VAEGGGLENRLARKGHGGSNPSSSATVQKCSKYAAVYILPLGRSPTSAIVTSCLHRKPRKRPIALSNFNEVSRMSTEPDGF
jgi:hypothetical protein